MAKKSRRDERSAGLSSRRLTHRQASRHEPGCSSFSFPLFVAGRTLNTPPATTSVAGRSTAICDPVRKIPRQTRLNRPLIGVFAIQPQSTSRIQSVAAMLQVTAILPFGRKSPPPKRRDSHGMSDRGNTSKEFNDHLQTSSLVGDGSNWWRGAVEFGGAGLGTPSFQGTVAVQASMRDAVGQSGRRLVSRRRSLSPLVSTIWHRRVRCSSAASVRRSLPNTSGQLLK